jgi:hypothetical protein
MRALKTLAIAAVVATTAAPVAAGGNTPMDVSHGIRLGQAFDPEQATNVTTSTLNQGKLYQVDAASNAHGRDLGKVYVALTPDQNKVYEIWAIRHFDSSGPCRELRDELVDMLEAKYPEARTERAMMSMDGRESVIKGDTKVSTGCKTGIGKATFYLRHRHKALHQQVAER